MKLGRIIGAVAVRSKKQLNKVPGSGIRVRGNELINTVRSEKFWVRRKALRGSMIVSRPPPMRLHTLSARRQKGSDPFWFNQKRLDVSIYPRKVDKVDAWDGIFTDFPHIFAVYLPL